jgi:hypothetical protein
MGLTFAEWLDEHNHIPTRWQSEVVQHWDALRSGEFVLTGGRQWGKTWLFERWSEYVADQA